MNRLFALTLVLVAVVTLAQDRTQGVPEAGLVWLKTEIVPPSPDDGGCIVTVYASNDAGISVVPNAYPYNGVRCVNNVRPDSLKAAKKDLGVGNGAAP